MFEGQDSIKDGYYYLVDCIIYLTDLDQTESASLVFTLEGSKVRGRGRNKYASYGTCGKKSNYPLCSKLDLGGFFCNLEIFCSISEIWRGGRREERFIGLVVIGEKSTESVTIRPEGGNLLIRYLGWNRRVRVFPSVPLRSRASSFM